MRPILLFISVSVLLLSIGLSSCFNDRVRTDPDTFVNFSKDTLAFDTVFTTLGSATRNIKIFNPYNESIVIDKIFLENSAMDFFRLNIDGFAGNLAENIQVEANDSIYVFAEVTIDPDSPLSTSPFIIEDKIKVQLNGNEQSVLLSAWGQNANYIPSSTNKGGVALLSCDFGEITWDDPKPYVIYGVLAIDSCELIIPAGTNIFVHGGVVVSSDGIYNDGIVVVQENGILTVNGTVDDPVTWQGDRLEIEFENVPGQWGGIIVNDLSEGSRFEHAIIKNSIIGVRVDSLAEASFSKVEFYNQSNSGLIGFHAKKIYAENCLFYNTSGPCVTLAYGGDYELDYCTMASFDSGGAALAATNYRCIEPTCLEGYYFNPINIIMRNCIISGDQLDEIIFDDRSIEEGDFTYELENCIVRVDELLDVADFANFFDHCNDCYNIQAMDTLFLNPFESDYSLDTVSVALGLAAPIDLLETDILENTRDMVTPDPGCYEFQD